MATIYIDGRAYEAKAGENLLQACLNLGLDLPYFCWHPAMGSVGACRQCAVKQYKDKDDDKGMVVMSCMTPAADQTRIDIDDEEAKAFRASVVEWLMINHPHDCPVCEEGGHCHLQDMTVMTGHDRRRYRFRKRTRRNQYLGPFIAHEMNGALPVTAVCVFTTTTLVVPTWGPLVPRIMSISVATMKAFWKAPSPAILRKYAPPACSRIRAIPNVTPASGICSLRPASATSVQWVATSARGSGTESCAVLKIATTVR